MADIYAQSSGNWSDPNTWQGGVLPGPDDFAVANGFIINVDQDVNVKSIRNNLGTTGGSFIISSLPNDSIRNFITSSGIISTYVGANNILEISASSGSVNLGSTSISAVGHTILRISGNGVTVNSSGDVSTTSSIAVSIVSICNVTFNNITSSNTAISFSFTDSSSSLSSSSNRGKLTLGNVTSNTNFGGTAVSVTGKIDCKILGNVVGPTGTNSTGSAIGVSQGASLTVMGNVVAGNGIGSSAINVSGNNAPGFIDIIGSVSASERSYAIYISNNNSRISYLRVRGPIIDTPSRNAIYSTYLMINSEDENQISYTVYDTNNNPVVLKSYHTESPFPEKVRKGVKYGPNNQLTGSMNVPHPNSVAKGIPVDGSIGNAILSGNAVIESEISSGTSIANRVKNIATISSVGEQLEAGLQ